MTGRGVTVVVVDDGVEHTIKDIQPNYVSAGPMAGAQRWQSPTRALGRGELPTVPLFPRRGEQSPGR